MRKTAASLKEAGADVRLCLVLANKSWTDDVEGVPLRALVRAATV
jgi:orotate phosphoribosyltransferase-like protein